MEDKQRAKGGALLGEERGFSGYKSGVPWPEGTPQKVHCLHNWC